MRIKVALVVFLLAVFAVALCFGQSSTLPPPATDQLVLSFLDQSVRWYRQTLESARTPNPEDAVLGASNRQLAREYLKLAFDYARAQAVLIDSQKPASATDGPEVRSKNLQQSMSQTASQLTDSQRDLSKVEEQLASATGAKWRLLQAQRDELKSEVALAQARLEVLQNLVNFRQALDPNNRSKASLSSQIQDLEQSVPELQSTSSGKDSAPNRTDSTNHNTSTPSERSDAGLLNAISSLAALREELMAVDEQIKTTTELRTKTQGLMAPLRAQLTEATQRGNSISTATQANDVGVLQQQRSELDSLTQSFKRISAVALPLARSGFLLDTYKANLTDLRKQLRDRASSQLRHVVVHLALLAAVIGCILLLSAAWRRATLRYVLDVRRRNQILLIRRIVVAGLIVIVLAVTLMAEVGALATYAGLVTAGLAVALQNIILSVIAYFFLIGRYGVHIGDRVAIAGITGKVAEIGLLRFHLLELKGEETDLHLSGRVVVFSNSVILQPTSHFFKQAPATDFLWHEMKLTCGPDTDCWDVERRLRKGVETIYSDYAQGRGEHRRLSVSDGKLPAPVIKVIVGQTGVMIIVRYPVPADSSSEIDEQVTRAVLSVIYRSEGVELSSSTGEVEENATVKD
jgi:small-conductance mechanosensitive channel